MKKYPFPHDSRVYLLEDPAIEEAFYSRGKQKYRRVRQRGQQVWEQTKEIPVDNDVFWMVVACLERTSLRQRRR